MIIKNIRESIESDIAAIKRNYHTDVSPEIGRFLNSIVSYSKGKTDNEGLWISLNSVHGLERCLRRTIKRAVSIPETKLTLYGIFNVLKNGSSKEINELECYVNELISRQLKTDLKRYHPILVKTYSERLK